MPKLSDRLRGNSGERATEDSRREKKALKKVAPDYAMLFFDHLYSEYMALRVTITNPETRELLEGLHEKRLKCLLTWSDIYSFDLTLVQARPLENLIRKAYDARAKYRSIAGQKEYDEYAASKPPNLPEILIDPKAKPPKPEEFTLRALRADLEYLLSKVYLYYAILPVRENFRDSLTHTAVLITLGAVAVIGILILLNVYLSVVVSSGGKIDGGLVKWLSNLIVRTETDSTIVFSEMSVVLVTVLTVALAGIVGGCVSMLQRIQSAPSEGDALFNLAALENGWKGIFLSPLYGAIFAALLFVLFAAGLLEGSAFPKINTPRRWGPQASATPSPTPSPSRSPSASPAPTPSPSRSPAPVVSPSPPPAASPGPIEPAGSQPPTAPGAGGASADQAPKEQRQGSPTPSPTPSVLQSLPVMEIKEFLKRTGPADGTSYALLIIWSFIAGFAERLVPDTLNRLVTKNEKIQGTD